MISINNVHKSYTWDKEIIKGVSFEEGATQKKRNGQIGGHKA